jgi:hypothetical protein
MAIDPLALAAVKAYCGWDPTEQVTNATALLNGNGTESLFLPSLAVSDVASVLVTIGADVYTLVVSTDVDQSGDVVWDAKGELRLLPPLNRPFQFWPRGLRNVTVVWSGGYGDTIPEDLMAALTSIGSRTSLAGATKAKIGTAEVDYSPTVAGGGLLQTEQWVLDGYRIPRVR